MTKATMPEPVGYVSARLFNEFVESGKEPGVDMHIEQLPFANRPPSGMNAVALITTDQAEAYAATMVRDALEQAIDKVAFHGGSVEIEADIRALIPPMPA